VKAAFVRAPFEFMVKDVHLPKLSSHDVLIKVKSCGICGTDLHIARTQAKEWEPFGHEISGIVEGIGSDVDNVQVGDKVVVESGSFCGKCDNCRNGRVDLCINNIPNIFTRAKNEALPMGFAEKIIVHNQSVVPFDGISFEEACLVEPLGVAYDLVHTTGIDLGDNVLIVGLGTIGILAAQIAKLMGAKKVIGANPYRKSKFSVSRKLGVDEIIPTDKISINSYKFSEGIDKALVTAPPSVIPEVMKVMNYGGIIGYIGIDYSEKKFITLDANEFHFRKLQLRASYAVPALYFPKCLELIENGVVKVKPLITHRFSLKDIAEIMKETENNGEVIKAVMINN